MPDLTWDEILGRYDWLYSQCVESEAMMGRWGNFAGGMLALIPQIRNLPELNDFVKWLSHFALVMKVPDKETELVVLYDLDSYVVLSSLPGYRSEEETKAMENKVSAENVVAEILIQIKKMREE